MAKAVPNRLDGGSSGSRWMGGSGLDQRNRRASGQVFDYYGYYFYGPDGSHECGAIAAELCIDAVH
ncbi:MAG: hypothetical protein COS34_04570 [Lysobacterales bacterium CG02_land_8_20_14_3_00_62_12]|nr:MAG: hypothetical protein COS34_04570 [Xanthomonadales bacterium CG02_land_8_20_14_3_00_62_12]